MYLALWIDSLLGVAKFLGLACLVLMLAVACLFLLIIIGAWVKSVADRVKDRRKRT